MMIIILILFVAVWFLIPFIIIMVVTAGCGGSMILWEMSRELR